MQITDFLKFSDLELRMLVSLDENYAKKLIDERTNQSS